MTDVSTEIQIPTTDVRWSDSFASFFDRHRKLFFAFLIFWYLVGFNARWRMEPDSALYLSIGRNIAEGRGYTYHGRIDRLAYPGMPWVHAAFFKMFPSGTLVPVHIFMMLCAMATLALTYRLLLLHGPRLDAVIVTYGVGGCFTFCRYGYELRNDMPFLMGVTAFLVGYESLLARRIENTPPAGPAQSRWFDWIFLIGGFAVAVLMRPAMWALVAAFIATIGISFFRRPFDKKRIAQVVVMLLIVIVAAAAFFKLDPRRAGSAHQLDDYEGAFLGNVEHNLGGVIKQSLQNVLMLTEKMAPEALFGVELGLGVNTFFVGAMLVCGILLIRRRVMWGTWILATLGMMVLLLPIERYLLAILPLLIYGWWRGLVWINHRFPAKWANIAFLILLGLGALPNQLRSGGLAIQQRRTPFLRYYKEGRYEALSTMAAAIDADLEVDAQLLTTRKLSRILTYLTRRETFDPRDVGIVDVHEGPTYVMGPIEPDLEAMLDMMKLRPGDAVFTIPRRNKLPAWTVHRAVPISPTTKPAVN